MRLCEERVRQLKRATAEVIHSSKTSELKGLVDLSRLAYSVRRSGSFKHFLQANMNRRPEPGISLPTMPKIIERLGKISKIYRAALTTNDFVAKIKELGRKIVVEAVPAARISIPELADRTATQLRERAGLRFRRGDSDKVERMLKRWPQYRQHAEIQLIVFYEEHPHIHVYSNHIGCNKYACYLCFNFIKYHAVFEVDGGHQSLYSLWTGKDTISFSTRERAETFQSALKRVSLDVEQKFQQLKATQWSRFGFTTANESPTNLSRISLFPALSHSQKALKEMSISAAVSQVQLASIREAPLEDLAEVEGHRKQTVVEQPNYATTPSEIYSSSPLVTVRAPSLTPTSKVLHSSSLDARISSPDDPNSLSDTFQTSGSPLDITGVPGDVQSLASKNLVVEQRRETLTTQHNIPPSATTRVVSPQASGADPLDELEVPNTGEGNPAGVVRHHKHRRRYRRLRGATSLHKGRTADRYAILLGRRTSMRQNEDSPREPGGSRRRRRRRVRRVRHQAPEASARDVCHPPTILPSRRTDKLRNKRVRRHKRERRKERGCLSGLIIFFRELLHIEVTNPIRSRQK